MNSEGAVHIALDRHDLDSRVRAVVGRDSLATRKPDPAPLLHVVERLGVTPSETLFVGDSERDAETARRAGTGFRPVDALLEP